MICQHCLDRQANYMWSMTRYGPGGPVCGLCVVNIEHEDAAHNSRAKIRAHHISTRNGKVAVAAWVAYELRDTE